MAGYLAKALELTATSSKRYDDVPKSNPFATAISKVVRAAVKAAGRRTATGRDGRRRRHRCETR
jgi:hypothetical protein